MHSHLLKRFVAVPVISQNDLRVHFGLGKNTKIDSLELHWPSGHKEKFFDFKANQILHIKEGHGIINIPK
ncbi:MAG: ASPIC/UnbV domain-containing protein [Candidatus Poribacteria bacterium]|nr:ASPIC/UnbV domain-containing protein [Candidatus Poribacteria bacterium]